MTPTRKLRLYKLLAIMLITSTALGLVIYALSSNLNLFYTPTQVVKREVPANQYIRVGGLVVKNSVKRSTENLTVHFLITDTAKEVEVIYVGILPDLFREGQGIVVEGRLDESNHLVAERVLAKHDENYMPPEAEAAVKQAYLKQQG